MQNLMFSGDGLHCCAAQSVLQAGMEYSERSLQSHCNVPLHVQKHILRYTDTVIHAQHELHNVLNFMFSMESRMIICCQPRQSAIHVKHEEHVSRAIHHMPLCAVSLHIQKTHPALHKNIYRYTYSYRCRHKTRCTDSRRSCHVSDVMLDHLCQTHR